MKKKIPVVSVAFRDEADRLSELPFEAKIAMEDVGAAIRDGFLAFASSAGLVVVDQLMRAELQSRIGPKHAKNPDREGNWHGTTTGSLVLGGRMVSVERPRGRTSTGEEIALDSWNAFSASDVLNSLVVERMLAGVATRRHVDVAEPVGSAIEQRSKGLSKSAVSRRFVAGTEAALAELMGRDLSSLKPAVLFIDGLNVAGSMVVAALVICHDGTKVPVSLFLGDTENKRVVTDLLVDLETRGLIVDDGLLVVIDGGKALSSAVKSAFGDCAVIQRCTIHKRRNVADYLPKELGRTIDFRLSGAFNNPDPTKGFDQAKALAAELKANHPDASASLLEGLDEMFTVRRLGISGILAKTLTNTNTIESMISITRTSTRRVKRFKDGSMKKRWIAAGMLEAERSFRRVRGYKDMPVLIAALHRHVQANRTINSYDDKAA